MCRCRASVRSRCGCSGVASGSIRRPVHPFVHMDVGGVRHWPRMSYDQLSRLFPDGKTVHIPSNGQPLPGYEEARAELEARGDSFDYPTAGQVKSKGFFAWLFGGSGDEEGDGVPERDQAGGGRSGKGATQRVASLDRGSVGSIPNDLPAMSGKDAGMHSFALSNFGAPSQDATPPAPTASVSRRRGRQTPVETASLPDSQEAPTGEAQQLLAQAMQRQAAQAQTDAAARQAAQAEAARQSKASQLAEAETAPPSAPAEPDAGAAVPVRPVSLPAVADQTMATTAAAAPPDRTRHRRARNAGAAQSAGRTHGPERSRAYTRFSPGTTR